MEEMNRRAALSLALVATVTVAETADALAASTVLHPGEKNSAGVSLKKWGTHRSTIPAYKSVAMADVIYQPGSKSSNPSMPNDMVCHVPEGELRVTRRDGTNFVARKGSVWTCRKGEDETIENLGKGVGIMRVIDLLPA